MVLTESILTSRRPIALISLWDMLRSYLPIYEVALSLGGLKRDVGLLHRGSGYSISVQLLDTDDFLHLLTEIARVCPEYGLTYTTELAARISARTPPKTYGELLPVLNSLNDTLTTELEKEAIFRIPPERKSYYERDDLFGQKLHDAFPSCARDIQKAGSCYALGQEDGCVHHLMLVLERGLNALASEVGVTYHHANWQNIIDKIASELKSMPRGPNRDFYTEVNTQFGFLKEAYRNHAQHAHDDPYDMPKALHILNHVRNFMQQLEKGGLSE